MKKMKFLIVSVALIGFGFSGNAASGGGGEESVHEAEEAVHEFEEGASAGCTGFARCGYWFSAHGLSMVGRLFGHPGGPHPAPNGGHANE